MNATEKAASLAFEMGPTAALDLAIRMRHMSRGAQFTFWSEVVDSIKDATQGK